MKKNINTDRAPQPIGPYSQAVQAGNLLFISGQIAIDPQTGSLVTNSFAAECRQVLENLKAIVEAGGSSLEQVVKVNISLTDLGKFGELNSIYSEYFDGAKPARACVEVAGLPKGVSLEIEAIALCKEPQV